MSEREMRTFRAAQHTIGQMRDAARATTPPDSARDDLLRQIRQTLDGPDRTSLRRAKDDRAYALRGFKSAMEYSQRWVADAVTRYVGAVTAEAAANRVEAREVRDLLAALLALHERESGKHMEQDTSEVRA